MLLVQHLLLRPLHRLLAFVPTEDRAWMWKMFSISRINTLHWVFFERDLPPCTTLLEIYFDKTLERNQNSPFVLGFLRTEVAHSTKWKQRDFRASHYEHPGGRQRGAEDR